MSHALISTFKNLSINIRYGGICEMEEKTKIAVSGVLMQIKDLLQSLSEELNNAMLRLERITKEVEDIAGKKIKDQEYVV
jgi:gas vesicle protein